MTPRPHEDEVLFREAVGYTTAQTGFSQRLVEKDYYCAVLLDHLAEASEERMVFRGGTCLAKVHCEFYRLSEDLDFTISVSENSARGERRRIAGPLKHAVEDTPPPFTVTSPLRGANRSTQYVAVVAYDSVVSGEPESVKIEIGLREPLLMPSIRGEARSILLDPVSGNPMAPPVVVPSISRLEALAEKFRAALTRREVAIRDFFDIAYFVEREGADPEDAELIALVRQKLAVPGNDPVRMGPEVRDTLRRQRSAQLRPVLRESDFERFDLGHAFDIVLKMAERIS